MIYLQANDGRKVIILETANLQELKKGHPAKTPDGSVVIAWTPDPVWLGEQISQTNGDMKSIAELIDKGASRPEVIRKVRPAAVQDGQHRHGT